MPRITNFIVGLLLFLLPGFAPILASTCHPFSGSVSANANTPWVHTLLDEGPAMGVSYRISTPTRIRVRVVMGIGSRQSIREFTMPASSIYSGALVTSYDRTPSRVEIYSAEAWVTWPDVQIGCNTSQCTDGSFLQACGFTTINQVLYNDCQPYPLLVKDLPKIVTLTLTDSSASPRVVVTDNWTRNTVLDAIATPGTSSFRFAATGGSSRAYDITVSRNGDPDIMSYRLSTQCDACVAPTIIGQPEGGTYARGSKVVLSVEELSLAGNPQFTWHRVESGNDAIAGTTRELAVTVEGIADYYVDVLDGCGNVRSATAHVEERLSRRRSVSK